MKKLKFIAVFGILSLILTGCGKATIKQNESTPAERVVESTQTDAQLIQQLFDGVNESFGYSSEDGLRYLLSVNYPGLVDEVKSMECIGYLVDADIQWFFTPDMNTLESAADWQVPEVSGSNGEWLGGGLIPEGRTYTLQVSGERIYRGDFSRDGSGIRHFTILNGKAYSYNTFCAGDW